MATCHAGHARLSLSLSRLRYVRFGISAQVIEKYC